MSEPATEAGRKLLFDMGLDDPIVGKGRHDLAVKRIRTIEREARADLAARIVAAVEGLPRQTVHADPFFPETFDYQTVGLVAVLDAIREASDDRRA